MTSDRVKSRSQVLEIIRSSGKLRGRKMAVDFLLLWACAPILRARNVSKNCTRNFAMYLSESGYSCRMFIVLVPSITYLLTPWSRVLLEKLASLQLVKKFPAFYGTRRFLTALTSPATCPYPEPAQSSPHTLLPPPEGPS